MLKGMKRKTQGLGVSDNVSEDVRKILRRRSFQSQFMTSAEVRLILRDIYKHFPPRNDPSRQPHKFFDHV